MDLYVVDSNKNYEPKEALVSTQNGTNHLKKIIKDSKKKLYEDGILIVEVGYDQSNEIEDFFKKHGFNDIVVLKDLSGIKRAISAKWKK